LTRATAARALSRDLAGTVVLRSDPGYESARRALVWNRATVERRPDAIVRAASEEDVVRALRFAREEGCRVGVRSGGHGWCAPSLREGGLLLDLGALATIEVDRSAFVASVGPAATNRALERALEPRKLAFPYGHCGDVALGGYVLGGGVGWNGRAWGAASDHLRALDVVLADGTRAHVDAGTHADLLWAARGAGPGFCAVATRLHLDLRPRPSAIASGSCTWRLGDAARVAAWLDGEPAARDPRVETSLFLGRSPGGERVASLAATAFADDPDEADRLLAFLRACPLLGCALERRSVERATFGSLLDGVDETFAPGHRWAVDDAWSDAPLADVVACAAERLLVAPSPLSFLLCAVRPLAGPRAAGALSRTGEVLVLCYARCDAASGEAADRAWRDETLAALAPLASGHHVNEADVAAYPGRVAACYADDAWRRLEAVCRTRDPDGVLHGFFA